jgi:hypothetical protein
MDRLRNTSASLDLEAFGGVLKIWQAVVRTSTPAAVVIRDLAQGFVDPDLRCIPKSE